MGGDARYGGLRRDIPRNYCAGADDRPGADGHATEDHRAGAQAGAILYPGLKHGPVVLGLEVAALRGGTRDLVVDEHHAVADEDAVADRDAVADERVALDL